MLNTTANHGTSCAVHGDLLEIDGIAAAGDDRLLKDREAALIYGVSRSRFWAGVKSGELPAPIRIGGVTRWSNKHLQADIRRRLAETGSEAN